MGEGFGKSYVPLHGDRGVKNVQNHPYVINEWPLIINTVMSTWKTKKGKTSKFMDAGGYNRNKRGINNLEWVDREGWRRKNKIMTLGIERCENIKTLYINK
jgi:hypothetical protein